MKPSSSFIKFIWYLSVLIKASDSLAIFLNPSTPTPNETLTDNSNSNSREFLNPIIEVEPIENSTLQRREIENATTTTPTNSINQTETETFTPPPGVQTLAKVINDTILSINDLIISSMRNVSRQGQHDFKKVADILQNMQTFLSARGTIISQDVETNLERELGGIQKFIGDRQQQFQNLSNSTNLSQIHILQVGADPEYRNTNITGNSRTAKGGPQSGMVNNFMQFSSKVGEGIRSSIEGAENIVTSSVNRVQNQIQNFLNGITNFFTKNTENSLPSGNGLQNPPPLMFRRQQVISQ